ncbi:MAG: peptidoglycan DD-metalloendopeptidase family protein [Clostridiales Family XIII bacterium]|nr:peptidoglycan DD-metalloendopeptidase family protein [Clostridiales Family XIII bacterium]
MFVFLSLARRKRVAAFSIAVNLILLRGYTLPAMFSYIKNLPRAALRAVRASFGVPDTSCLAAEGLAETDPPLADSDSHSACGVAPSLPPACTAVAAEGTVPFAERAHVRTLRVHAPALPPALSARKGKLASALLLELARKAATASAFVGRNVCRWLRRQGIVLAPALRRGGAVAASHAGMQARILGTAVGRRYALCAAFAGRHVTAALFFYEARIDASLRFLQTRRRVLSIACSFAVTLVILSSAASAHMTFYEYSIAGEVLGVVKDRERVTRTVEYIGSQIDPSNEGKVVIDTEQGERLVIDKNQDIVIEKKILQNTAGVEVDSERDIVQKISALEDVSIIAYTLDIDGQTMGTFPSVEAAKAVTERVLSDALAGEDPSKYKESGFTNTLDYRQVAVPKSELSSPEAVYAKITQPLVEVKYYEVKAGDNIFDISLDNDMTIDQIEKLNPDRNLDLIYAGDKLLLQEERLMLSVKTVEQIQYEETYKADPEYNDTDKLYEGEEIVQAEGTRGRWRVTADLTRVDGVVSEMAITDTQILTESIPDKILRGTKTLPPSIGKGYFVWPANGTMTSGFKFRWGRHHNGIDIGVRYGPVFAADGGKVIFAGNRGDGYGNKIVIDHGANRQTLYAHLSELSVKEGETVFQGQTIAISGNTGATTGPHLHFEIHIGGVPKNPLDYL